MRTRRREASREHGFQDDPPESGWSPQRQRFEEQVGLLVKALRSKDEGVRDLAVVQISQLGPKAVPYLGSALEDALDESDARQSAHESMSSAERGIAGVCSALGIIRDSDAVMTLAAALPRKEAVEALAKIGGERALELIMDMIEGKDSSWPSSSADSDPAFVRRVFLRFGEAGRKRLQDELANGSSPEPRGGGGDHPHHGRLRRPRMREGPGHGDLKTQIWRSQPINRKKAPSRQNGPQPPLLQAPRRLKCHPPCRDNPRRGLRRGRRDGPLVLSGGQRRLDPLHVLAPLHHDGRDEL